MKVKDLSGRWHPWNLTGYSVNPSDTRPRSEGHLKVRKLLHTLFFTSQILEEVGVPGEHLFLDFFIPLHKLIVEFNGSQHFSYSSFFYKDKDNFQKAKTRDSRKAQWAALNGFNFIELRFDETEIEWRKKILR